MKKFINKDKMLNEIQEQIVIGSLLGDACLSGMKCGYKHSKNERVNSYFAECHSSKQKDYLIWKYEILKDFCLSGISFTESEHYSFKRKNMKFSCYGFKTCCCKVFTDLEKKWYLRDNEGFYILKNDKYRIKIVPLNLKLTPLILAIWYLDDGSINYKKYNGKQNRNISLFTNGFSYDCCLNLLCKLKELGIKDLSLNKVKDKVYESVYYRINVRAASFVYFLDLVKEGLKDLNIPDCMKYKFIIENYKEPFAKFGEGHQNTKFSDETVLKIVDLFNSGLKPKKITELTGTNIRFVRGIIYNGNRSKTVGDKLKEGKK